VAYVAAQVSTISAVVFVFGILGIALALFFALTMVLLFRHRRRRLVLLAAVGDYARDTTAIDSARRKAISVVTVADLLTEPKLFDAATRRDR